MEGKCYNCKSNIASPSETEHRYVVIDSALTHDEAPLFLSLEKAKEAAFARKEAWVGNADDVEVSIAKIIYDVDAEIVCALSEVK